MACHISHIDVFLLGPGSISWLVVCLSVLDQKSRIESLHPSRSSKCSLLHSVVGYPFYLTRNQCECAKPKTSTIWSISKPHWLCRSCIHSLLCALACCLAFWTALNKSHIYTDTLILLFWRLHSSPWSLIFCGRAACCDTVLSIHVDCHTCLLLWCICHCGQSCCHVLNFGVDECQVIYISKSCHIAYLFPSHHIDGWSGPRSEWKGPAK